jgi:hypothetical protein
MPLLSGRFAVVLVKFAEFTIPPLSVDAGLHIDLLNDDGLKP